MTRSTLVTLAALLCGISASALAGTTPHPTAIDADGDGAFVATVDVNGDGSKNHLDIGVRSRDLDCDDYVAAVNPKAAERPYDGIDNDCNSGTGDNLGDLSEDEFDLFLVAEYGGIRPTTALVDYETGQCKADSTNCRINTVAGRFELLTDAKVFVDYVRNGTLVLWGEPCTGKDGRELTTPELASHSVCYNRETGQRRGGSASGGSYTGPSKADRKKEAIDAATPLVDAEAEARLAADAEHDRRIGQIETGNAGRDEQINRLGEVHTKLESRIAANKDAIADEAKARAEADKELGALAHHALRNANAAASYGPLFEAGIVGGAIGRKPLVESGDDDDQIRGSAIGGGGFELRAGVDASGYQVAGFGQFGFGSDGQGTGPDTSLLIGADVLFDAGSVEVGPWVGFLRTEDHANLLDVSVIENGGLVGVTVQGDVVDGAPRVVSFTRVGGGLGYYGSKGTSKKGTVVVSDYGGLFLAQAGIRFGAGALQD